MGSIFTRASAGLNLTPLERAALRALEGLGATAFIAAVTAVAPMFAGGSFSWANVAHVALVAAAMAVLMALSKYFKAFGDAPLNEPGPASAAVTVSVPSVFSPVAPAPQPPVGA